MCWERITWYKAGKMQHNVNTATGKCCIKHCDLVVHLGWYTVFWNHAFPNFYSCLICQSKQTCIIWIHTHHKDRCARPEPSCTAQWAVSIREGEQRLRIAWTPFLGCTFWQAPRQKFSKGDYCPCRPSCCRVAKWTCLSCLPLILGTESLFTQRESGCWRLS